MSIGLLLLVMSWAVLAVHFALDIIMRRRLGRHPTDWLTWMATVVLGVHLALDIVKGVG